MARLLLLPAVLATLAAPAQTPPASQLMAAAQAAAKRGDKAVLTIFHATWCPWCRRLEGVLAKPDVKAVTDRHFVIQWLTIKERGPKQVLDNPGAAELYAAWGAGAETGLPFCAILDAEGVLRASSIRALTPGAPKGNLGFPGDAAELKAFAAFLKEGAPALTEAELAVITSELEAARPRA